ncbi:MAG: carboxypeptidase-like regulatory domain-containing protein [Planctomycetes bacterium]|nr:carboxypeptidase-like regulatory domain-containing protein [Planctomycetota bacterium]
MSGRPKSAWLLPALGLGVVVVAVVAGVLALRTSRSEVDDASAKATLASSPDRDQSSTPVAIPGRDAAEGARQRVVGQVEFVETAAPTSDLPIVLAGRVVDESGAPLPAVEVELEFWGEPSKFVATSDHDGHYAVRGRSKSNQGGSLRARLRGFVGPEEDLDGFPPSDADDHVIVLQHGAILAGRFLFDTFLSSDRFDLFFGMGGSGLCLAKLDADGEFEFSALPGGSGYLIVKYDGQLLPRILDVPVVVGEVTRDPRLNPLDLRGQLREWRGHFLRPDGTALSGETITLTWQLDDGLGLGQLSTRTDADGYCVAVIYSRISHAWLDVAGCLDQRIDLDTDEWTLRAMPHVTISVDPRARSLFDGLRLDVVQVDGSDKRRASIDSDGQAEVTLDTTGRYQVVFVPMELGVDSLQWPEHVIDVRTEPADQYFVAVLNEVQLAALTKALGR